MSPALLCVSCAAMKSRTDIKSVLRSEAFHIVDHITVFIASCRCGAIVHCMHLRFGRQQIVIAGQYDRFVSVTGS